MAKPPPRKSGTRSCGSGGERDVRFVSATPWVAEHRGARFSVELASTAVIRFLPAYRAGDLDPGNGWVATPAPVSEFSLRAVPFTRFRFTS